MTRRPSLAEQMKPFENAAPARRPYVAVTCEGLKCITVAVNPEEHKKLKRLAIDAGRSIKDLMRGALADLFAKHARQE
jgi:hypothetical protein